MRLFAPLALDVLTYYAYRNLPKTVSPSIIQKNSMNDFFLRHAFGFEALNPFRISLSRRLNFPIR